MNQTARTGVLAALGYAVFEPDGPDTFRLAGDAPKWLLQFPLPEANVDLADAFPFLEVFLPEARQFWSKPGTSPNLRSDFWTQTDIQGVDHHLSATAISGDQPMLLIESAAQRYQEQQEIVRYAHEMSLAYDQIQKLSRELARATEAKSEFLARMSHEIRTPMNSLLGMAELLWDTQMTPEQREYVRIFRRSGDNLLAVINDILDFSKVEAGQIDLEQIEFDLADILEEVTEVVSIRAHSKNLELSARIGPGVPQRLIGDPGRLRQILLNLLGNAIKFTERGEIAIGVELEPDRSPWVLHFTVSDSGIGIPQDRIDSIFESFSQADASTTRKYGGTGLGLAISKRFVELMGGKIWAASVEGWGTTMHFTAHFDIPAVETRVPAPEFPGLRALIVEERVSHRGAVADILKSWGAQATESDPSTQITGTYDLLLVDGKARSDDGPEDALSLAIRLRGETLAGKVFLMLTTNKLGDAERCRQGGIGFLTKPVRRAELRAAIQGVSPDTEPASNVMPGLPKRQVRILVADDGDDNRLLINGYLKHTGYVVDEAENGAIAVEKFKQNAYDLVLTDAEMPEMDGYAATGAMRAFEKDRGRPVTPILVLTAHALQDARAKSKAAGCTDHLTKPIGRKTLLEAIGKYVKETAPAAPVPLAVQPWLKAIIPGYLEKRRNEIPKMRSALERGDFEVIRATGHQITGTGSSYGFDRITEIGKELEHAAVEGDRSRMGESIEKLDAFLRSVQVD